MTMISTNDMNTTNEADKNTEVNENGEATATQSLENAFNQTFENMTSNVRRTYKDLIFQKMFECVPEYKVKAVYQLAGTNHPDLQNLSPDEIELIPLGNVFINGLHNDISFMARDKVLFMIEAQSTWSVNIVFRILTYYVKLVLEWLHRKDSQGIFNSKKITLPKTYFCCVYTGQRKNVPEQLTLQTHIVESDEYPLEVKVKVIHNESEGILGEYIGAARTLDATIKKFGYTKENALTAINNCITEGYLVDFMKNNKGDIMDIMEMLNDTDLWAKRFEKELQEQVNELTAEKDKLLEDKAQLVADNSQLAADNSQLAADNSQLAADKAQLAADNSQLAADKTQLAADKAQLAADKAQLAADNSQLVADNSQLAADKTQLAAENKNLQDSMANAISQYLKTLHGNGTERAEAVKSLMMIFSLDEDTAEQHLLRYWDAL